jgi:hypothetical protein
MRIPWLAPAFGCAIVAGLSPAGAQMTMNMRDQPPPNTKCAALSLLCAATVTPTFAANGDLWVVARVENQIFVSRSGDKGRTFSQPVVVTPGGQTLDWGPDARPKIVVDGAGRIVLAYAIFRDKHFNGEVFFTRSIDGGATFAPPRPITAVQESQRFEAMAFDGDGSIFSAWLDKRNRVPFKEQGKPFVGASLAFAWSKDNGETFSDTKIAFDNTCECCRLAIGFAGPGWPVVLFRKAFDAKVRDHGVTTFSDPTTPGPIQRVSVDDWATDTCPHAGPSLAIGADGSYHAAWFTQGRVRKGLFYAFSRDQGATFSEPMRIGAASHNATRPFLLAHGGRVFMAWKEFDGDKTTAFLRVSNDQGATWSEPRGVAATGDDSDHPILISDGRHPYLSWHTEDEGYRLFNLEDAT